MIGGLQGEFGDLDIKYLETLRRISQVCKMAAKFRNLKDTISQPKADFAAILL